MLKTLWTRTGGNDAPSYDSGLPEDKFACNETPRETHPNMRKLSTERYEAAD